MKNRVGEKNKNNQDIEMIIIEYYNSNNITIMFEDGNIRKDVTYSNFKKGNVTNYYFKGVLGVGCIGNTKWKK